MPTTLNPQVDAYIAAAAPFAQPILRHLRALVHRSCPGLTEEIKWRFPAFMSDGKILCHMAAFKAHAAFGVWHAEVRKQMSRELGKEDEAMGLLGKITQISDLPSDAKLRAYLQRAAKLLAAGTPARPPRKPRPEAKVPADLAADLKRDTKAAATFANFSPSHRREYIEWITEAKRPETRAKRLKTTLKWLAAGKARNWKYVNC